MDKQALKQRLKERRILKWRNYFLCQLLILALGLVVFFLAKCLDPALYEQWYIWILISFAFLLFRRFSHGIRFVFYNRPTTAPFGMEEISTEGERLKRILTDLCDRAGIESRPNIIMIHSRIPIFGQMTVFGRWHFIIAGKTDVFTDMEARGIMAHELGHILGCDHTLSEIARLFSNTVFIAAWIYVCLLVSPYFFMPIMLFFPLSIMVLFIFMIPDLFFRLANFSWSRQKEYESDLWSAKILDGPVPAIVGLKKIKHETDEFVRQNSRFVIRLGFTHPKTSDRIRELMRLI